MGFRQLCRAVSTGYCSRVQHPVLQATRTASARLTPIAQSRLSSPQDGQAIENEGLKTFLGSMLPNDPVLSFTRPLWRFQA